MSLDARRTILISAKNASLTMLGLELLAEVRHIIFVPLRSKVSPPHRCCSPKQASQPGLDSPWGSTILDAKYSAQ